RPTPSSTLLPYTTLFRSFLTGLLVAPTVVFAQIDNKIWKSLSSVSYTIEEDESGSLYVPKFSDAAKQLEGKTVSVSGYIVPFDEIGRTRLNSSHVKISYA